MNPVFQKGARHMKYYDELPVKMVCLALRTLTR